MIAFSWSHVFARVTQRQANIIFRSCICQGLQVLEAMSQAPARGPKRRKLEQDHAEVLAGVQRDEVSADTLARRLAEYVDRVDSDMVRLLSCTINGLWFAAVCWQGATQQMYVPSTYVGAQALEYQMQQGMTEGACQELFLMPLSAQHEYGPALHANVCIIRLLHSL